tara:strand:- start:6381 stop:6551 length:171 start_codon:yes stop_codon:yes gene_type:complete
MCICASEPTRPRLFNYITVALVSAWVVVVSVVAHSVDITPVATNETLQAFVERLIN